MSESNLITSKQVLSFNNIDEFGLNDFHKAENPVKVAIDKVGISRYRVPLSYQYRHGEIRQHDAEASLYINCPAQISGINMSRLCRILNHQLEKTSLGSVFFKKSFERLSAEMWDDNSDQTIFSASIKLEFKIVLKQKALKSNNAGWQYYDCTMEGRQNSQGKLQLFLTVNYEYSSTCPCSLSMSKQYEKQFRDGELTTGNGVAVAHSQRSGAVVTIEYDTKHDFYIEDLIDILREAIPTETQSSVKRIDEQAFAILNAQNPMFVEHAARRLSLALNQQLQILDWRVAIEHWESLHSHNASALICKGLPGGLS